MIRNPFKAILSFFRHEIHGVHSTSSFSLRKKSENIGVYYTDFFHEFASIQIKKWRLIIEDWITAENVMVVHYEDVVEDKVREIVRILFHLGIDKNLPRLECFDFENLTFFRRKSKNLPHSPFSAILANEIWKNVEEVDVLLRKFDHKGIPFEKYEKIKTFETVPISFEI